MSKFHNSRDSAQRNRDRARIKATHSNCGICGDPIDFTLKWPDPRCFVVDHKVALARGGRDDMTNKQAAHNSCNSKKRARDYAPIIKRSGALD